MDDAPSAADRPASQRLLLVEDEFLIRLMLAEALTEEGYEVVEAADADEAMAAFTAGGPWGALLTDVQLPGPIDGHELASRLRARVPGLPILYMTGRPEPLGPERSREVVVGKPFSPSEICRVLSGLLRD